MESDSEFSEENIGTNYFDSLSEKSISDEINEQNKENEENTLYENFYIGINKITKWFKFENKHVLKIKKISIVKEAIGLQQCAKDISNELNAFLKIIIIINLNRIDEIVKFTNMYVAQLRTNRTSFRERDCKETTRSKFLAYLCFL